jgi:hypothetical protein
MNAPKWPMVTSWIVFFPINDGNDDNNTIAAFYYYLAGIILISNANVPISLNNRSCTHLIS